MLSQFNKFLVVKIADRVQQLSQEKCMGCVQRQRHDQLHDCTRITLLEKIEKFLPTVKEEAMVHFEQLYELFKKSNWLGDFDYRASGISFVEVISSRELLDRRFINEDTDEEHPFDMSWLMEMERPSSLQIEPLPPILPLDLLAPVAAKPRKRKATSKSGQCKKSKNVI